MSDKNKFWLLIDLKLLVYSNCIFIINCSLFSVVFLQTSLLPISGFHTATLFYKCGVVLRLFRSLIDGSEDELIHCFKENQPCSAGLQRIKVKANTIDEEDPFVSLSDSDVKQEAINELDSDDENDEIIDI